jgi:TPR repeat protein
MNNLGAIYAKGQLATKDCETAKSWYAKAAAKGNEAARLWLEANEDCLPD